ncbi:MAG: hypothetical protein KME06_01795 [Kastovskya adunca ATA6-11-RM4]|jgi:hypothetical protein|nr:hypothetical protein [Kastovskya adunca ATA6-11-RM4]
MAVDIKGFNSDLDSIAKYEDKSVTDQGVIQPQRVQDSRDSYQNTSFKMAIALCIGVGLIYLAFLKPGIWGIDGNDMVSVAKSLVTEQNFTVPPEYGGVTGHTGQHYSRRYPLLPILATPFVAVGLALSHWFNLPEHFAAATCALVLSILLTAATTALVALLALRLGSTSQGAYIAALSFAFGTIALVYGHTFFAEPLLAFLTVASIYLALGRTRQELAGASILAGLAAIAKPTGIVVGPILSLYFLAKRRPLRLILGPILAPTVAALLYLFYNYIRFGNVLTTGQPLSNFTTSGALERFLGLLFSPGVGGGLIWYCPPVLLAIIGLRQALKSRTLEALVIVGVFLGYLLLHSFWLCCGWDWGPRFLVPALPGLMALTGLVGKSWWKWLIALTIVGFLINAPTLVSFYQRYYFEVVTAGDGQHNIWFWGNFTDAPLFHAWGAAYRQVNDALAVDIRDLVREASASTASSEEAMPELLRIVAVWWWVLPAVGIPMWVGVIVSALLVSAGVWVLRKIWRHLPVERELSCERVAKSRILLK